VMIGKARFTVRVELSINPVCRPHCHYRNKASSSINDHR
jgi:hypothetical protein